ncbi:MAG: peptidylprolyl isomerase [Proteobacteria bacterium]|nr:peptidylprolyl isomerase [Pseudomonadota bacterium]
MQKNAIMRSPKLLLSLSLVTLAIQVWARTTTLPVSSAVVSQSGATVTLGDVDAYMARIPADKWAGFVSSAERIESMLKDILRTKQLAQQARDLKLDQSPSVKAQIAYSEDEVLAKLRFKAFVDSIKVPDLSQLAKEEYLSHKDQYLVPANVTVQQILISTDGRTDDNARKLAETVRIAAAADPDHFDALVEQYSDDPSKDAKKGLIKDATSSKLMSPIANAAGELSVAMPISPVIKTKYGYHVLKLVASVPPRQQTFDEVKSQLVEGLDKQYIADQKKDFLNHLAGQEMTPYPDAIAALHARYFTGTGTPVQDPPESAGAQSLKPEPEAKQ